MDEQNGDDKSITISRAIPSNISFDSGVTSSESRRRWSPSVARAGEECLLMIVGVCWVHSTDGCGCMYLIPGMLPERSMNVAARECQNCPLSAGQLGYGPGG
jgi:hypothetical protein